MLMCTSKSLSPFALLSQPRLQQGGIHANQDTVKVAVPLSIQYSDHSFTSLLRAPLGAHAPHILHPSSINRNDRMDLFALRPEAGGGKSRGTMTMTDDAAK